MVLAPHTQALVELINEAKSETIAEIGCLEGVTADAVRLLCSVKKYYMIDPWCECREEGIGKSARVTQVRWDKIYDKIINHFGSLSNFEVIRETSLKASQLFDPFSLDLVFIDAIHSYERVKQDIRAWYPIVKRGGIICGDDYFSHHPGVKRAVDEMFPVGLEFRAKNDRVWVYRKSYK
jgi:hypothetical protein